MATHLTSQTVIREVVPGDDLEALYDLSRRAFGPMSGPPESALARGSRQALLDAAIDERRIFAAFDGDQLVASARYHNMRQWWHGRSMPMAGVAAVMVAPEYRGQGVGRKLMTALLEAIAGRGYPVSVLYPATTPIYRSLGWELAGGDHYAVIPARSLRTLVPPDVIRKPAGGPGDEPTGAERPAPVRRAGPKDAEEVLTVIGRVHEYARDNGPITRDRATVARWLADPELFAYLASDGFLAYHWHRGHDEILVQRALASSDRTLRDLWSIVASHSSIASTIRARTGPADPVLVAQPRAGRPAPRPGPVDAARGGRARRHRGPRVPGVGAAQPAALDRGRHPPGQFGAVGARRDRGPGAPGAQPGGDPPADHRRARARGAVRGHADGDPAAGRPGGGR